MATIVEFSPENIKEICALLEKYNMTGYIVFESDLEKKSVAKKSKMNKDQVMSIIPQSKSIIANIDDDEEEDALSMLSLYSVYQPDPFKIIRRGTKRDIVLFQEKG